MGNSTITGRTAVFIICMNNIPRSSCFLLKVVVKSTFFPDSSSSSFVLMQIPSNQVYRMHILIRTVYARIQFYVSSFW